MKLMSDDELVGNILTDMVFNIECYPNYFVVAFKHVATGGVVLFETSPEATIDCAKLEWLVYHYKLIGFNSASYDIPLTMAALQGRNAAELCHISNRIVKEELRFSALEQFIGCKLPTRVDHIDLIEIVALAPALETLNGRMHASRVETQPIGVDKHLTREEADYIRDYCIHKLDSTINLYQAVGDQIELRRSMSLQYGVDLRSKSDAQIAEAVLASELEKVNGYRPKKPKLDTNAIIKYQVPAYIAFESNQLNSALALIRDTEFNVEASGAIVMPDNISKLKISMGRSTYQLGIGGLHSTEKSQSIVPNEGQICRDADVCSYYPSLILTLGLYPKQCGKNFASVYKSIVDRRVEAKRAGDKVTADSLKIVCNGSYGKFGSKYSCLYSPALLLTVTLTGQLALLMLIERLENSGISVVSANTDGVVSFFSKELEPQYDAICNWWQQTAGLELEFTDYRALHSRDVNSYIAVKPDGKVKTKGAFTDSGTLKGNARLALSKNPSNQICTDAVIAHLTVGTPIEVTVRECHDVTKFLTVTNVTGGAHKDGVWLGKVIRFYYAENEHSAIRRIANDNLVACTEGCKPLMCMESKTIPKDLDYNWYIKEANSYLYDLGVKVKRRGLF